MKKGIVLILIVLLLSACGSDETNAGDEMGDKSVNTTEVEPQEELQITDNTMEFADQTNDINFYDDGLYQYEIIATYGHDKADEKGINEIPFEDYIYRFSVMAVKATETEQEYIVFVGETENNTEDNIQFNSDIEIVTSNKEQSVSETAVGETNPGVIEEAFILIPIDRGVPDSFTLEMQPPWIAYDNLEQGDYVGNIIQSEFHKE